MAAKVLHLNQERNNLGGIIAQIIKAEYPSLNVLLYIFRLKSIY